MSLHPRGVIRRDLRAAIGAAPAFAGVTVLAAWGQSIDTDTLPAVGVFTPRELVRLASAGEVLRSPEVHVQLRREGGDELEDTLDADAVALEAIVLPVLAAHGQGEHQLDSIDMDIAGEGKKRIGKLNMVFRAARFAPEGQG